MLAKVLLSAKRIVASFQASKVSNAYDTSALDRGWVTLKYGTEPATRSFPIRRRPEILPYISASFSDSIPVQSHSHAADLGFPRRQIFRPGRGRQI